MISNGNPVGDPGEEVQWGVSPDPEPTQRSPIAQVIWIILSILIILSLVLPWILPYLTPRPRPEPEGLQALLIMVNF